MADLMTIVRSPATGVQLVQVESSTLPGEIEAGDLLRIDFDQHHFTKDGLYVLQRGTWTGVRRFTGAIEGPKVLDIDRWADLPPAVSILGRVDMVYTSRRTFAEDARRG